MKGDEIERKNKGEDWKEEKKKKIWEIRERKGWNHGCVQEQQLLIIDYIFFK